MKAQNRYVASLLAALLLVTALLIPPQRADAFTSSDADTAMNAFVNGFYNSSNHYFYTNSDHVIHSEHASGPQNGLYSDFWWEAQLWEVVMDAYQRTNSPTYRQMIDDVYNGFVAYYPTFDSACNCNDDIGWWALASARAYELTGNQTYLNQSINLFNKIWAYQDSTYGGGIWWNRTTSHSSDQKNVATNAPAVITAVKLANATGDSTYLTKAQNLYSWIKTYLTDGNGHVYDHRSGTGSGTLDKGDWSYNFGTYMGAAASLYGKTNTASYLTDANNAANWAMNNLNNGGTLKREGGTPANDADGFKMILARYMNQLVTQYGQSQYQAFLQRNANEAWSHRRTGDNLIGTDWSDNTSTSWLQSLEAAAGADILQFVSNDGYTGLQPENGWYEAENGIIHGNIGSENTNTGYTGRGYLAGWNGDGTWLDLKVNAPTTGQYEIKFHYAAGAGNASRQIYVNGATVVNNYSFPSTGAWSSWNTATLNGVNLNQGTNTVSVIYCSSCGSTNYVNLDNLQISVQLQAENGTRYGGIGVESTNAGYTGTGYLAGWNQDGQYVDLPVTVSKAGYYTITFRYAAAAGNASRYLYANGAGVVNNLSFANTGSWSTWSTVTVNNVYLNGGNNTISLIYNSSLGSTNWLNLDELTLRYTP